MDLCDTGEVPDPRLQKDCVFFPTDVMLFPVSEDIQLVLEGKALCSE